MVSQFGLLDEYRLSVLVRFAGWRQTKELVSRCGLLTDGKQAKAMVSECGLLNENKLSIGVPVLPDECRLSMGAPVRLAG